MPPLTTGILGTTNSGSGFAAQSGSHHTDTQSESAPLTLGGMVREVAVDDIECNSPHEIEIDSAASSELSSSSSSLRSTSIFDFTYANGRRYHSDRFRAEYFMPNDESEQDRLDLYHHLFLHFLGGNLHAAPLEKPRRVLDVGTGTGIWAIEFAYENPQTEIIGTDISPVQPSWVPPNCSFEIEDMEEDWVYPDNYFDFVHMRSLSGSFSDWAKVLDNVYRTTSPGGYFEFQDYGCELFTADGKPCTEPDPERPLTTWLYHIVRAAEAAGRPLVIGKYIKQMMEKAGFVDVVEYTSIWAIGTWPKDKRLKEAGKWGRVGLTDSLYPFGVHLLTKAGWTVDQVIQLCEEVTAELGKSQYYFQGWFVYGRKPANINDVEKPTSKV